MDLFNILFFISAGNVHKAKVLIFQNSRYSDRNCLILSYYTYLNYTYLMKFLLTAFFTLFLSFLWMGGFAQSDPSIPQPDDSEFNLFLLALAIAFFSVVIGAIITGSILVTLFLLLVLALVSAGILSAGILVGFYRKSLGAGFRTALLIICSLTGILLGSVCFMLINNIFKIHLTPSTAALAGACSGLLGGFLLGIVLAGIIRIFMNYCRQKLSF